MDLEEKKEALINEIVERELAMFLATPNEGGPSVCQTRPQSFRMMRRMTHSTHDISTLESYLDDLKKAAAEGRNFMIEKYARMDNRLPPLSQNPLLDKITDAECAAANWKPFPTARWNSMPRKSTVPSRRAAIWRKRATTGCGTCSVKFRWPPTTPSWPPKTDAPVRTARPAFG